jgi:hypothetical protein
MNDLATRLRRLADTRRRGHSVHPDVLREAANAIDNLTAERDEARRMYCGRVSRDVQPDAFEIAKNHGWDCFPQEDEPCQ